jgi:tetratricopeptide (TPR) repeat protein
MMLGIVTNKTNLIVATLLAAGILYVAAIRSPVTEACTSTGPAFAKYDKNGEPISDAARARILQLLGDAGQSCQALEDDLETVYVRTRIAQAYARMGDATTARGVLHPCLARANLVEEFTPRTHAYLSITAAMVRLGDARAAVQLADAAENDRGKREILRNIAYCQSYQGDLKGALATANALPEMDRWNALSTICQERVSAGDLESAEKVAALINPPRVNLTIKQIMARAYAKAGRRADARKALQEASEIIDSLSKSDEQTKNLYLLDNIQYEAAAGEVGAALATVASLKLPPDDARRKDALREIAQAQAKAGDFAGALKTCEELPADAVKARALAGVAYAQAEAGDSVGAGESRAKALSVLRALPPSLAADKPFATLARVQGRLGNLPGALAALSAIPQDHIERSWALMAIAKLQVKANQKAGAIGTYQQAAVTASALADNRSRAGMVALALRAWAEADEASAVAWAKQQNVPYIKAHALVGAAEGIMNREGLLDEPAHQAKP